MVSLKNKTKEFVKTASGLLVPKKEVEGYPCGYCPRTIILANESGGHLFMANGKPVCAVCRIMKKSKFANQIRRDKKVYLKERAEEDQRFQNKANELAREAALMSQERHKDAMITK